MVILLLCDVKRFIMPSGVFFPWSLPERKLTMARHDLEVEKVWQRPLQLIRLYLFADCLWLRLMHDDLPALL